MADLGMGLCRLGLSLFGYGSPVTTNSTTAKLLLKSDGTQGNVPLIDPDTQDFVLDANGNHVGDYSVNQQVYLALRTQLNSTVIPGFGMDLSSITTITPNIQLKLTMAVNNALKDLVSQKLITINNVNVKKIKPTGLSVYVAWTDLTTGGQNTFKILN